MNRIRQKGNIYQLLVTPPNTDLSTMIGNWSDSNFRNFCIYEFTSMEDALYQAYDYPDLDWTRLSAFHKDIYVDLYKKIKFELDSSNFIYDFEPVLLSGEKIKEFIFNRVENYGERFFLSNNLNDVVSYHIINPWTKNLKEMAKLLSKNKRLRIVRQDESNGIIKLIGETDISTNYEIVLWPTILSQWSKWVTANSNVPEKTKMLALKDAQKNQQSVDSNVEIR